MKNRVSVVYNLSKKIYSTLNYIISGRCEIYIDNSGARIHNDIYISVR